MEQLLQTVGRLEDIGHLAVQFADDLVDGLLPRRLAVLAQRNGNVEFSERDLGNFHEAVGDLRTRRGREKRISERKTRRDPEPAAAGRGFGLGGGGGGLLALLRMYQTGMLQCLQVELCQTL